MVEKYSYYLQLLSNGCFKVRGSLRFLSPSDAVLRNGNTGRNPPKGAQQYEYRNSPPPSNMKEYIQYFKQEKEKNRKK